MHKACTQCGNRCCRYFCLVIGRPETYEDFEQIRWYLLHERVTVHVDAEGEWCLLVNNRCRMLDTSGGAGQCRKYANRPIICRHFSPKSCDFVRGGIDAFEWFNTADELEAYARRMLGDGEFGRARAKSRGRPRTRRRRQM